ncbi:cyclase family protein [Breoghania sp. L-A4]|uniref:cyclase family protein n=1 Tax=Breoghania sp. L-A4 TaxID=2304600 RepID=UPI000E358C44|nr:cyclase family protein [Breoghania sp. L-A4]AXS42577.1 cyclase family protein [Breoghania sp. L-A4]
MCVPGCQEAVVARLSRRGFFKGAGAAAATAATFQAFAPPARAAPASFSRAVDLTHRLVENFPTYFGGNQIEFEKMFSFEEDGFNVNRWHLVEHTGTHMDAPLHFSKDGASAADVPVDQLVLPLAVIDVKAQAAADPDYQVSAQDLLDWETANGPLPQGGCVAMNSGWDQFAGNEKFRNADADGKMHFPGFALEATELLMERGVTGMAVDTLSLDYGLSTDFVTHYAWLPSGRWGMEAVANLDQVPATGATLVVGAPKIAGASGGPSRLIALV